VRGWEEDFPRDGVDGGRCGKGGCVHVGGEDAGVGWCDGLRGRGEW
jgi:hypothetical protein